MSPESIISSILASGMVVGGIPETRGDILLSNEYIDSIINARVVYFETTGSAEDLAQAPVMLPQSEPNSTILPVPRPTDIELIAPGVIRHNATSSEPETAMIAVHSNPTPTRAEVFQKNNSTNE